MYSDATHLQGRYEFFDSANSLQVKKRFALVQKFFHNVENVHIQIVIYFK